MKATKSTEITTIKDTYFSPEVWGQMKDMATTFIESKALPQNIANAQQAIMIMQSGYEMGMKPMEALKSLYIVNGQINIWGQALMRRLREHGWRVEYKNSTERGGSVTAIVRKDKEKYEETASFDSAEKSGYTKLSSGQLKVGWREGINRQLKLRYLAISMLIKTYIPEVMGSVSDIQEIVDDYPVVEEETKKVEVGTVLIQPVENRKNTLNDFLKKNKEKKNIITTEPKVKVEKTKTEEKLETAKND
jgi:hypothetical protein